MKQLKLFREPREIPKQEYDLNGIARIALTIFHPGTKGRTTIGRRLAGLRMKGYPIQSYSGMTDSEVENYYNSIVRDVREKVERESPQLVESIRMNNRRILSLADALG